MGKIGDRIREIRKTRRMSLEALGARLSLTQAAMSKIERGESRVDADMLPKLAEALDVSPALFFVEDEQELLRHGIAAELRVPLDLVGKLTYRLSGDEAKKGSRPAPIELVVGGDPARTAAVVKDALAPVIAEEVKKAVREELGRRLPERSEPAESPAITQPTEGKPRLADQFLQWMGRGKWEELSEEEQRQFWGYLDALRESPEHEGEV